MIYDAIHTHYHISGNCAYYISPVRLLLFRYRDVNPAQLLMKDGIDPNADYNSNRDCYLIND